MVVMDSTMDARRRRHEPAAPVALSALCAVCGAAADPALPPLGLGRGGREPVALCSLDCLERARHEPERVLQAARAAQG